MKAPERLVQLHQTIYEKSDDRKMLTTLIEPASSLTADVAVKFMHFINNTYDNQGHQKPQFGVMSDEQLFNYFINNEYKPE